MLPLTNAQLDQFSCDILSDVKATRQQARARLIQHTASFQNLADLTEAEQANFPNWHRVSTQMRDMIANANFPYAVDTKKAGEILGRFDIPVQPAINHADFEPSNQPCYIVTMAHTPKLGLAQPLQHLAGQIDLLWNEGFGANAAASQLEADNRMAVVVGINYCHSLDTAANKRNKQYIANAVAQLTSTHVRIGAFNWKPVWVQDAAEVPQKKPKRLFRLLADANPAQAQVVFSKVMADKSEIIPYQRIRNEIKNDRVVVPLYTALKHGHANRPSFLVSWDDDAVRLRTEDNTGLFSHYDQLIAQNPNLEVASTGYYMTNANQAFIEFASRADMVARQAIAHTLPNGAYLPEPNLIIKIASAEALRNRISFLRKGPDKGKGLEFIGLLENLNLMKGNVKGRVVLGRKGPLLTSQPPRATVPAHMPAVLTPIRINNKKNLASLRMFCQSTLNPKKGFAANTARALPQGLGSQKNTAKISKLYTALDPIDYIKSISNWKDVYVNTAEALVSIYNAKLENPDLNPNFNVRAQHITGLPLNNAGTIAVAALLQSKTNDIWSARTELVVDAPRLLTENQFRTLFITALNANKAVYAFLRSRIDQTPFVFPALLDDN